MGYERWKIERERDKERKKDFIRTCMQDSFIHPCKMKRKRDRKSKQSERD